uniref:PMT_2 domain-containing protein n=1 Tax=Bursaphelenchus xylophilus TaxID=6326 RepID=A0A1I7SB33_BURXY
MCCYFACCSCFGSVRWQVCVSNTGLLIGLVGFFLIAWFYKLEWIILPFALLVTYSTIRKLEQKKPVYWYATYVVGILTLILLGILSGFAVQEAVLKPDCFELTMIFLVLLTFVPFHLYTLVLVYMDQQNWLSEEKTGKKIKPETLSAVKIIFKDELQRQESKFDARIT